jgi:putative oxidoreductase
LYYAGFLGDDVGLAAGHASLGRNPLQPWEDIMTFETAQSPAQSPWQTAGILVARLIFAGVFLMAVIFKFADIGATAGYIAAAGFPFPLFLAWCAALLEVVLFLCLLTGAFFSWAALVAAAYVLFLAFAFHGPSHWAGNQAEFGFFIDHFTFIAGLLFAAMHGPGRVLALRLGSARA